MQLLNTLYVTLPDSYLRLENDTLRLLVGDETRLRVPLCRSVARPSQGARGLNPARTSVVALLLPPVH
jgi:CRISPR-associated protein Cas1